MTYLKIRNLYENDYYTNPHMCSLTLKKTKTKTKKALNNFYKT